MRIHIAASSIPHELGWDRHFNGWVVSPTYAWWVRKCESIESNWPIIVDNGAWTDHTRDRNPPWHEMLQRTLATASMIQKSEIQFMTLPDRVGDWFATSRLIRDTIELGHLVIDEGTPFERAPNFPMAIVLQDGFDENEVDKFLFQIEEKTKIRPWIFIGGSSFNFKKAAITICQAWWPEHQIHVGRISKIPELVHCHRLGIDSVDTSTFSRPQLPAFRNTLNDRLSHWEAWKNGDQTVLTDWMDA